LAGVTGLETSWGNGWGGGAEAAYRWLHENGMVVGDFSLFRQNAVESNNWGAVQFATPRVLGLYPPYPLQISRVGSPPAFLYRDSNPDKGYYPVYFQAFATAADGAKNAARTIFSAGRGRDRAREPAQRFDWFACSTILKKTVYYQGVGATEADRIGLHYTKLSERIVVVSQALGIEMFDPTRYAQRKLRALGYDIGKTGPQRDGVDGVWGKLCKAALLAYTSKRTTICAQYPTPAVVEFFKREVTP
jgi:hypothetical protein